MSLSKVAKRSQEALSNSTPAALLSGMVLGARNWTSGFCSCERSSEEDIRHNAASRQDCNAEQQAIIKHIPQRGGNLYNCVHMCFLLKPT